MDNNICTKQDLLNSESRILKVLSEFKHQENSIVEWVKTSKAKEILGCSSGTLQNLRIAGKLQYSKILGSNYYKIKDLNELLENNRISHKNQ